MTDWAWSFQQADWVRLIRTSSKEDGRTDGRTKSIDRVAFLTLSQDRCLVDEKEEEEEGEEEEEEEEEELENVEDEEEEKEEEE